MFNARYGVETIQEPLHEWCDFRGHDALAKAYENPEKYAMPFQTLVSMTLAKRYQMPSTANVRYTERSLFSARYCFTEHLLDKNHLDDFQYDVLDALFDTFKKTCPVDLIIYLRTSPETCLRRVRERNRNEEASLTLDHLKDLHKLHEDWLMDRKFPVPADVIEIDANRDTLQIMEQVTNMLKNTSLFLSEKK